jgi:hypothetical protein
MMVLSVERICVPYRRIRDLCPGGGTSYQYPKEHAARCNLSPGTGQSNIERGKSIRDCKVMQFLMGSGADET